MSDHSNTAPVVGMAMPVNESPLFAGLSGLEFKAISAFLKHRQVRKGEVIFREGDQGKELFILLSGAVSAFVSLELQEPFLRTGERNFALRQGIPDCSPGMDSLTDETMYWIFDIKHGGFFGEMSLIDDTPRSATIIAKEDSCLMTLSGEGFYHIVFEYPMIGSKLLKVIGAVQSQWLDKSSQYLQDLIRWGETARRRAITDDLTGLFNRRFLEESIAERFVHGSVGLRQMSLLMLDLDRIHEVNERYGSRAGDQVIIAVADVLKSAMRTTGDIAARFSGDEFAVLLPNTDGEKAFLVAERIRENIMHREISVPKTPDSADKIQISIQTCIGIASAPAHASDTASFLSAADNALRKAKEKGRNRVEQAG
jgi:diguanylate cyclase (GGDEF)-like protein